ncbi:MAG: flagellar biosynthesis protein FlhF [Bdellovibrionota bacterium]|nr:flagellar biosynthesis protein FlhF [Bdellovibrionota bacterium]
MQVRKFEANSMQEALAMVKKHLGPEAVILAARDNKGSFGLKGESSVEVTAAVSEAKLQQHQYALSRLRDQDREKVMSSSASQQKKFIEKSVSRFLPKEEMGLRARQYIDILDDEDHSQEEPVRAPAQNTQKAVTSGNAYRQQGQMQKIKELASQEQKALSGPKPVKRESNISDNARRVKEATQNALSAFSKDFDEEPKQSKSTNVRRKTESASREINELKRQIASLEKLVQNFRDVPQNFIPSHPGANHEIPYELSPAYEKLLRKGIDEKYACELILGAKKNIAKEKWQKNSIVNGYLAKQIMDSFKTKNSVDNGIHVFVGNSASGKTSSLIKMAARLVVNERKSVAILTTDTMKLGATEQLKIYAKILNVPFGILRSAEEWPSVLNQLKDVDCILVDTPGVGLKSLEEIEWIKKSIPSDLPVPANVHLVQSVTLKNADAKAYAEKFKVFNFEDIIFTKLDETTQHGAIYNQFRNLNVPILGFGIGTNLPEDFEFATSERIVDLLFQVSK